MWVYLFISNNVYMSPNIYTKYILKIAFTSAGAMKGAIYIKKVDKNVTI